MKKLLVLILSLLFCLSFVGCNLTDSTKTADGRTSIKIWTVAPLIYNWETVLRNKPNDPQAKFTKWFVESFEKDYPQYQLDLIRSNWGDSLNEDLMRAISGGTLPDVVVGEQYVRTYVINEHFDEIDIGDVEIIESAKAVGQKDGKWYAVPAWTGSLSLCVNKIVLREAGVIDMRTDEVTEEFLTAMEAAGRNRDTIDPFAPATWEDLLAICRFIKNYYNTEDETDDSDCGGILMCNAKEGSSWRALGVLRTAGGEIGVDDHAVIGKDPYKDKNIKAFEMMRELAKTAPARTLQGVIGDDLWNKFLNGYAAYIFDGTDIPSKTYGGAYPAITGEDLVCSELPVFETDGKKSNVMVGTGYYSITKTSKNKEGALAFIKYLLRDDVQVKLMETDMRIPVVKDVLNGEELKKLSNYAVLESYTAPFTDPEYDFDGAIPSWSLASAKPSAIWEAWDTLIDEILVGTGDIAAAVQKAQAEMEKNGV